MDLLITRLNNADMREQAIQNPDDEKAIGKEIVLIQKDLRILVERWRNQLPSLYE
jgi:hypothetical protein